MPRRVPNTSPAVRQSRSEPHDSLDDFPTPPWATRALVEFLRGLPAPSLHTVREPAANRGHMVRPLAEAFEVVLASDVHDYGVGYDVSDYLWGADPEAVDWTITNPPFRLAEQFIERALRTSRRGCAFILRTAFLEGAGRFDRLFSKTPPRYVLQFSERVVMHRGRLSAKGSSATAYAFLVFSLSPEDVGAPTELVWIPPCRKRLERNGDYCESLTSQTTPQTVVGVDRLL